MEPPLKASRALAVWDEFGSSLEGGARPSVTQQANQQPENVSASLQTGSSVAQAWLTALARHCESSQGARAKAALTELLHCGARSRSKVVLVSNRARQQIALVYSWTNQADKAPGADSPQRARQCQYLYERVLHGVLRSALDEAEAAAALEGGQDGHGAALTPDARHRVVEQTVEDAELQLGIINACVEVVNYAYLRSPEEAFPYATLLLGRIHHTLELWQGCDWIMDHLAEPLDGSEGAVPGMPEEVADYLAAIQVRVEEELAFIDNSHLYRRMVAAGTALAEAAGAEPGGSVGRRSRRHKISGRSGCDEALVSRFLENLGRTAMYRTHSVCQELLSAIPSLQTICPALPQRVCTVMDTLCFDHCDLLFGQHLSVCLACAIYYTVRLHGKVLPFRKITSIMAQVLPNHSEATFTHVELPPGDGSGWGGDKDYGDARAYYNRVFLQAFAAYDATELFGDELPPTPAKQQLEAPDPAPRSGADGSAQLAQEATAGQKAAEQAAASGAKEKRVRRPLGQVSANGNIARVR